MTALVARPSPKNAPAQSSRNFLDGRRIGLRGCGARRLSLGGRTSGTVGLFDAAQLLRQSRRLRTGLRLVARSAHLRAARVVPARNPATALSGARESRRSASESERVSIGDSSVEVR